MAEAKALVKKQDVAERVRKKLDELQKEGAITMPKGYNAGNALKQAWLMLSEIKDKNGKLATESCSQESIANAFLSMCTQGLNPAKKQCYLIPYGTKLELTRSYLGTMAMTKRIPSIIDIRAQVVYAGDTFKARINPATGSTELVEHTPDWSNQDPEKIIGAYCVILTDESMPSYFEYMNMEQIKKAWAQGAAKGNSGAHRNFPDQMAKKTVISRACKYYANTCDDDLATLIVAEKDESRDFEEYEEPVAVEYTVDDAHAEKITEIMAQADAKVETLDPGY